MMNQLRLINTKLPQGEQVVGYQESRWDDSIKSLCPHQSQLGNVWYGLMSRMYHVPHDAEDRSTGEVDSKGVGIFENDEVLCSDGEHGIVIWKESGWYLKRKSKAHAPEVSAYAYLPLCFFAEDIEVIGRASDSP